MDRPFRERDAWALLACLFLGIATALYAGLALRGLFGDGVHLLIRLMQGDSFWFAEPSRITAVAILEAPTLAALKLGIGGLHTVAAILSVTLNILPLLVIALCFGILPQHRRAFFLLPAFATFGGIYAAWYVPIAEGLLATAYFWLLFYLLLFAHDAPRWRILIVALAIPTLALDEPMAFLAPVLALAALRRRGALSAPLALWFLAVALHAGWEILHPYNTANRDRFAAHFLLLHWLRAPDGHVNGPAVLLLCAGAAIAGAILRPAWRTPLLAAFTAAAFLVAAGAFLSDRLISPGAQFDSRYIPQLLSLPLALVALASLRRPAWVARWATSLTQAIVLILGLAGATWNIAAVLDWQRFTATFRAALARHEGLVSWDTLIAELNADDAARFKRMNWAWNFPELSIVLSPGGDVHTILADPAGPGWRPFDPAVAAELPSGALFSTSAYRAALPRAR